MPGGRSSGYRAVDHRAAELAVLRPDFFSVCSVVATCIYSEFSRLAAGYFRRVSSLASSGDRAAPESRGDACAPRPDFFSIGCQPFPLICQRRFLISMIAVALQRPPSFYAAFARTSLSFVLGDKLFATGRGHAMLDYRAMASATRGTGGRDKFGRILLVAFGVTDPLQFLAAFRRTTLALGFYLHRVTGDKLFATAGDYASSRTRSLTLPGRRLDIGSADLCNAGITAHCAMRSSNSFLARATIAIPRRRLDMVGLGQLKT